jgi:hypothetical protein
MLHTEFFNFSIGASVLVSLEERTLPMLTSEWEALRGRPLASAKTTPGDINGSEGITSVTLSHL